MRQNVAVISSGDILAGQVRAIQNIRHHAHVAFLDWAAWSRRIGETQDKTGHQPHVKSSSLWNMTKDERPTHPGFLLPITLPTRKASTAAVCQDPLDADDDHDLRQGERIDTIIHTDTYEQDWRHVAKAVYYYLHALPYQWPDLAKVKPHRFPQVFDAALTNLALRM